LCGLRWYSISTILLRRTKISKRDLHIYNPPKSPFEKGDLDWVEGGINTLDWVEGGINTLDWGEGGIKTLGVG
jgi:hypothetical protein